MAAEAAALIIKPAIAFGLIIGAYEAILLHRDVSVPAHRFGHTLHALGFALLFTFITMNTEWFLSVVPAIASIPLLGNVHVLRVAVGLIAILKIHGASAAIQGSSGGSSVGLAEKWSHSLVVGALIVGAPYLYPLIQDMLPAFLRG